ncbi:uncharacterized protein HD556DRAFT_1314636 [Suillus plorans]|uniref:Heterokaryon incompatibility domain-containing protein n=1 Tax=Suillus plorans TaxID=116603 RepID=A0A9P7A9M8_9AGAM|nr:uncharacterized protein HD556DRAFT_1314636 [Suillus plorans]KAG1784972.1 hypothetical protein HD556DRAFT_1314636 [Suillus plorans]
MFKHEVIDAQLVNAPRRVLDTTTGLLCDRETQIDTFKMSTQYKKLVSSTITHVDLDIERIKEVVKRYLQYAMLSHRWEGKEPLLQDIQGKCVYDSELDPVGGMTKLWSFCKTARDAEYNWAWSDTCCIDKSNNVEVQESVNSMFEWYHHSVLTIVYLSDNNWTLYRNDLTPNHKDSIAIMQEIKDVTGIDRPAVVPFRPNYGEKQDKALGRLLQEIVARSGDITGLDWDGESSEFNSCLPASITSYEAPPCQLPPLPEEEIQSSVSSLRKTVATDFASNLYTVLRNTSAPRFAAQRLHLPCLAFNVRKVRRVVSPASKTHFTYEVEADGLHNLLITTAETLAQFWQARPIEQKFVLVRPWDRSLLELPEFVEPSDYANDVESEEDYGTPPSPSDDWSGGSPVKQGMSDLESRALRLLVHLGQPFGAFLLAQQHSGEYKRIATDYDIIGHWQSDGVVSKIMDLWTFRICIYWGKNYATSPVASLSFLTSLRSSFKNPSRVGTMTNSDPQMAITTSSQITAIMNIRPGPKTHSPPPPEQPTAAYSRLPGTSTLLGMTRAAKRDRHSGPFSSRPLQSDAKKIRMGVGSGTVAKHSVVRSTGDIREMQHDGGVWDYGRQILDAAGVRTQKNHARTQIRGPIKTKHSSVTPQTKVHDKHT